MRMFPVLFTVTLYLVNEVADTVTFPAVVQEAPLLVEYWTSMVASASAVPVDPTHLWA